MQGFKFTAIIGPMLRELRQTKINDKIYLFPVPVIKDRKYLILCKDQLEALKIIQGVAQKKLQHPDLLSDDFIHITFHSDGLTKIMALNPKHTFLTPE
jgi:hypothetical protein